MQDHNFAAMLHILSIVIQTLQHDHIRYPARFLGMRLLPDTRGEVAIHFLLIAFHASPGL